MDNPLTLVIDTRYKPYSRIQAWQRSVLEAKYGGRYRFAGHVLGNVNYRSGGPIHIANAAVGVKRLIDYLMQGYNLVLLCACKEYETCHRRVIVEAVQRECTGVAVIHSLSEEHIQSSSSRLALSFRQPYAYWLTHPELFLEAGIPPKAIENREWTTSYRGTLLIHASRTFDTTALAYWQARYPRLREVVPRTPQEYPRGAIVGHAELIGVVEQSLDPWFLGTYGFVFANATPQEPRPYPGQLKLFSVPVEYSGYKQR